MEYSAPDQIKGWLECLFWFAAIFSALAFLKKTLSAPAPHPPNSSLALTVSQLSERVQKLESCYARITEKLEEDKDIILRAGEERVVKLHDRLNDVLSAVSELRGTVYQMNRPH